MITSSAILKEEKVDITTAQEDYYRDFQTNMLMAWVLSNALLVAIILTSPTCIPADGQPPATACTAQAQPLLPCPACVGVTALLEPHNIFDSDWHGLGGGQPEYVKKCAKYDRMDRTLVQVLAQIEERAPNLAQQHAEYERVQSEVAQLASQLTDALVGRDSSAFTATDISQRLMKMSCENGVQGLLKEIARRQDPTIPSDEELEADEGTAPTGSIDKNQKLFGIICKMGTKMEAGECRYRGALEKEQGEAVRGAHEAITALQEQLEAQHRAHDVKMQAFMLRLDGP
ncbi:hypothetical protein BJV78DRAFT_1287910 [Lactifluus subvellereus]|nr:hypothetical protein BJV78DRAFT_1287910 [Lactifluus subvellereus]